MQRDQLRLELLRLTYAHGRDFAEAVARAKVLEDYVFAGDGTKVEGEEERKPALRYPGKKSGNSILS